MQVQRRGGFTLPFLLGTALGIVSGAVVGALVARRAFSLGQHLIAKASGNDGEEELRLDLLLQ